VPSSRRFTVVARVEIGLDDLFACSDWVHVVSFLIGDIYRWCASRSAL
jgi:hypothetical protein